MIAIYNKIAKANEWIEQNKSSVNNQYRLNYHLMGEMGWINDPNGFIEYKGRYHMFYQHYPYEPVWGPMHWGHAVSKDLIKWEYLPVALAPDREFDKDGCFSGSAIEKDGMLYLMYTGHVYTGEDKSKDYIQTQCLAYSYDGITFEKLVSNPVIDTYSIPANASLRDFRDPKIFKADGCYYTLIGSKDKNENGQVLLYKSKDLKKWEYVNCLSKSHGSIGNTWECPDIFKLGDRDILVVSPQYLKPRGNEFNNLHSTIYMLGNLNLDCGTFSFDEFYSVDYGFDFYAPQTILDSKGRRIMLGWMDMWETPKPTQTDKHNWAGAMTLPREVVLKGSRLYFKPVEEIADFRRNEYSVSNLKLSGEEVLQTIGDSYELDICFDAQDALEFGLKLRVSDAEETIIYYNKEDKLFYFNRDKSGSGLKGERRTNVDLIDNKLMLQIFVDKSSVEVFINEGEKVMTGRIYPSKDAVGICAFSKGDCILTLSKWDIV